MTKKTDIPSLECPQYWKGWEDYDCRPRPRSRENLANLHRWRKFRREYNALAMTRTARLADPRTCRIPDWWVSHRRLELRLEAAERSLRRLERKPLPWRLFCAGSGDERGSYCERAWYRIGWGLVAILALLALSLLITCLK